ncbi:hypothetical protein OG339_22860 [Streptosporangium sp. NBC_01495]|uniref:hypothetical protein n=1 Tax=Streptosporangium sp. NBC_01495 TaxID=2903899 RepID=UPI002E324669|nr:hypothetical protein [Streptosporangium sp. NBC_01495]
MSTETNPRTSTETNKEGARRLYEELITLRSPELPEETVGRAVALRRRPPGGVESISRQLDGILR